MEFKLIFSINFAQLNICEYRTSVEFKRWYWCIIISEVSSEYRTSVEFKQRRMLGGFSTLDNSVSIEPVWNLNKIMKIMKIRKEMVSIEPVWNLNHCYRSLLQLPLFCEYRTSVEFKHKMHAVGILSFGNM